MLVKAEAEAEETAAEKAGEADASAAGAARGKEAVAGRAAARKTSSPFFLGAAAPGGNRDAAAWSLTFNNRF